MVRGIQADVAAIAALGDPSVAGAGERIAAALDGAIRSRLLEFLGEAAAEVTAQVPGQVDVRLDGTDATLVFVGDAPAVAEAGEDAATARITLRLPEDLKRRAEAAAQRLGISLNTWLVRAAAAAADAPPYQQAQRASGKTMRGWASS